MKAGWEIVPMGELCTIRNGKSDTQDAVEDGAYAFFDRSRTVKRSSRYLYDCEALIIPGEGTEFLPRHFVGKFDLHQRAYALFGFSERISVRYLYYFLHYACDYFPRVAVGATVKSLRMRHFEHLPVSLTSVPEQQRIVAILDDALAAIATARANAQRNLQNARGLFESHLRSTFAEAWGEGDLVRLSDLATDITDGDHLPPPKADVGVPFITIGNINKETRTIGFGSTFRVAREYLDSLKPNRRPRKGDVLYTVTGSYGVPVLVNDDAEFCFQRHIGLVRPSPATDSAWLAYLLLSPQVRRQADDGATGTAQKTVPLKVLRAFTVPALSLPRQRQIAAKLDALSADTSRLAARYERKLAALEELKQSLLHQAFAGEL